MKDIGAEEKLLKALRICCRNPKTAELFASNHVQKYYCVTYHILFRVLLSSSSRLRDY